MNNQLNSQPPLVSLEMGVLGAEVVDGDGGIAAPSSLNAPSATPPLIVSKHRTARAAATWAAGTVFTIVTLAVAFITTPLLLKYLGQERMGAYRAAGEWIGYLSLIDLGITPALGVLVLRARAKGSISETAAVFRSGLTLLAIVAGITAVPALILSALMPHLVAVSPTLHHELIASTHLSIVLILLLPFQMSRMLLEAEQRGYWGSVANLTQSVTAAVLSVILARRGYGLVAQSGALVVGATLGTMLYLVPTWRWYIQKPSPGLNPVTPKAVWKLGWPLALSGLGIRLNGMTDSLVVGFMLGPIAVFHLFVTQRLVAMFGNQVNSMANASWAALADLRMTGRHDAFVAGIIELTELVVGLGVALTGTVAAFNRDFVRLWVGADHYGGETLTYLTAAVSVLTGLAAVYGFSLDSAGETAARIPVSIAGAIGNLIISIALVKMLGLPGVILGTVIAGALSDSWFCPYQVHRLFGVPATKIIKAVVQGSLRAAPWALAAAALPRIYRPAHWLEFVIEAIIVGSLSIVYVWLLILGKNDRHRWGSRVMSLTSRWTSP